MTQLNIYPYCNCFARGQFKRQDGYTLDGPSGLWVHPRCRKPSKMNYERMVLGLHQIPQTTEIDIVRFEEQFEMRKIARREIAEALNWEEDSEDEYSYN